MELNADFSQRTIVHSAELEWKDSPMAGVQRRMLDRIGDEVARATSIVRYAPGSRFSPHVHSGGEEFIVLEGVFQDEHGDFPAGSYVRNPPQSSHTPGSEAGCIIFVKLWQFDPADRAPVMTNINKLGRVPDGDRPGVAVAPLFQDERETVRLEHWDSGASVTVDTDGGAELLVLDGTLTQSGETLSQYSWMRVPIGATLRGTAGPDGARIWVKSGHLRHVAIPMQS